MMKGLILAVQFLSRIPINISVEFNEENLRKSTFFYPLTGMIIGGIAGFFYYIFSYINKDVASFIAVLSIIITTGGLHLDGIGDTADGFYSARDRKRMLEIMKDSRIGSHGVVAIVLDILFKYILISNMEGNISLYLAFSCANARFMAVLLMSFAKIARPGGLGDMLASSKPRKYAIAGGVVYGIIVFRVNPLFLMPLVISLLWTLLVTLKTYKTIGGFTGDVYGATIETTEIISLITFAGVLKWI